MVALGAFGDPQSWPLGEKVLRVVAVGKEFFIVFSTAVLRLHFGMSGGAEFRNEGQHLPAARQWREAASQLLAKFTTGSLFIHGATVKVVALTYLKEAEQRARVDILSPAFDYAEALRLLRSTGSRMVCDAVMDQKLLPGVGNVIKVEGLFSASVHPLQPMSSLSDQQCQRVLRGLRSCAQQWYDALRGRGRLAKMCYGRQHCTRCNARVLLVREGALGRVTYFCERCQPSSAQSRAAAGSSGSGNDAALRCATSDSPVEEVLLPVKEPDAVTRQAAAASEGAVAPKREGGRSTTSTARREEGIQICTPMCSCNKPCTMRQTFKEGPNKGRYYFTCSVRRCRTFQWVDSHLPRCQHGAGVLRRVLKMGPNNGRWFVACPGAQNDRCNMFHWAVLQEGRMPEPGQIGTGDGYASTASMAPPGMSLAARRQVAAELHRNSAQSGSHELQRASLDKKTSRRSKETEVQPRAVKRTRLVLDAEGSVVYDSTGSALQSDDAQRSIATPMRQSQPVTSLLGMQPQRLLVDPRSE